MGIDKSYWEEKLIQKTKNLDDIYHSLDDVEASIKRYENAIQYKKELLLNKASVEKEIEEIQEVLKGSN